MLSLSLFHSSYTSSTYILTSVFSYLIAYNLFSQNSTNNMKVMDLFCSSPASTAVTYSMDHPSSSIIRRSKSTKRSYVDHEGRKDQIPLIPCSSQLLPINPKTYLEKHRKSSAEKQKSTDTRRKSSVHLNDLYDTQPTTGSSGRYLLGDAPFIDLISPQRDDKAMSMVMKTKESHALVWSSSSSAHSNDQVVVLRVSLHCKACEGKLRKHILKMEGVRSFNIEMEKKKVTIIGEVTPLGVLESVSKVKNAQLWPSTTSSSTLTIS